MHTHLVIGQVVGVGHDVEAVKVAVTKQVMRDRNQAKNNKLFGVIVELDLIAATVCLLHCWVLNTSM